MIYIYIPEEIVVYERRVRDFGPPYFYGSSFMYVFYWTAVMGKIFRLVDVLGCHKIDLASLYLMGEAS